jgi:hypothetical protein
LTPSAKRSARTPEHNVPTMPIVRPTQPNFRFGSSLFNFRLQQFGNDS